MAYPAYQPQPPAPPAPAPVARPAWGWGSLVTRMVLTAVGAAGLIIGAFLDWNRNTAGTGVSIRSLWSTRFLHRGASVLPTIGFVAIVLGLVAIVGLAPRSGLLTRLAGALGIVAFVLFLIEVYRAHLSVSDLDVGAWVMVAGAVVALVGGFFGTRSGVVASVPPAPR